MLQKVLISTTSFFLLTAILTAQPKKVVLIEEATGTWCSWCPMGKVFGEKLLEDYAGEIIFIEVHGNDPMENEEYKNASGFWSYPSGHLNRKMNQLHIPPERWENILGTELNKTSPVNVNVETVFDTSGRNLTVNVSAEFFETLSGDYRLGAIVVEDAVTGDEERFGQRNLFAENAHGIMGGFETLPKFIPHEMMVYDHVGRHLLGGYSGEQGSLPEEVEEGNIYTHSFDWTLPKEFDKDHIWVAAVLINHENGEVLNAGKSIYISGNNNPKPFFATEPVTEGRKDYSYSYNIRYHDANDSNYKIEILDPIPEWLEFEKLNIGFAELRGIPKDTGTYDVTLRLSDTEYTVDQSFQLTVKDSIPPLVSRVEKDFLILPNPNYGVFDLEFDRGTHFQVFDNTGKKVSEGDLLRNRQEKFFIQSIDLSNLNSGLYILKVFDNTGYFNSKNLLIFNK